MNDLEKSILDCKKAIEKNPNDWEAYYDLRTAYTSLHHYKEAIDAFKQAIYISPNHASAYYDLGNVRVKKKIASLNLYKEAIKAFKQVIRNDPTHANDAHLCLGLSCFLTEDKNTALNEYKILKELDINLANQLFNLINAVSYVVAEGLAKKTIEDYGRKYETAPVTDVDMKTNIPDVGREISWKNITNRVFRVLEFDRNNTTIEQNNTVKAKSLFKPYGYLLAESPILNQKVRIPIIHRDDFLLAASVFVEPKLADLVVDEELLVAYPKHLLPKGLTYPPHHVLYYVLTPRGTLDSYYSINNDMHIAKPEPQKLFGSFVYQGEIKVQNTGFIKDTLRGTLGSDDNLTIKFKAVDQKFSAPSQPTSKKKIKKEDIFYKNPNLLLNPKYTFVNFVVGNSNRFAHAACLAVAQSPGKAYNPLFVYGEVGLGKTHLMQAIGNYIKWQNGKTRVLYISSEKFTNELINSIRDDRTVAFRNKYRGVDVLLIDDIQFLAGKKRAQVEFFHIFNTLYESNKQIVITSDRLPKDIANLEERLIFCFERGLITDTPPLDLKTRIAILRKKKQSENLNLPTEVINFIADKIPSNIRQLEGALTKLTAYSILTKKELSIPLAQEILKDIIP